MARPDRLVLPPDGLAQQLIRNSHDRELGLQYPLMDGPEHALRDRPQMQAGKDFLQLQPAFCGVGLLQGGPAPAKVSARA